MSRPTWVLVVTAMSYFSEVNLVSPLYDGFYLNFLINYLIIYFG